ncbi:ANR family transcriptional regulator [Vibrio jasicida]|uniref:ANR family transcriptional regulator n=1 Tax=Vibrio jasicida TaxID=766224 RepID=UPI0034E4AFA0
MLTTESYLDYAHQACDFERNEHWQQAYEHWKHALFCAIKPNHRHWAETRAQFCAARASIPFQLIKAEKPTHEQTSSTTPFSGADF